MTFFAKQFKSMLEEKKAGKTVGPRGKAVKRMSHLNNLPLPSQTLLFVHTKN